MNCSYASTSIRLYILDVWGKSVNFPRKEIHTHFDCSFPTFMNCFSTHLHISLLLPIFLSPFLSHSLSLSLSLPLSLSLSLSPGPSSLFFPLSCPGGVTPAPPPRSGPTPRSRLRRRRRHTARRRRRPEEFSPTPGEAARRQRRQAGGTAPPVALQLKTSAHVERKGEMENQG